MHSCQNQEDTGVLEYATESIVLQPFHDKLFDLISKQNAKDAKEISKNCDTMNSLKLDMSSLGSEVDLDAFRPRDTVKQLIAQLSDRRTPIEKMVTFKEILNLIREDLMQCIQDAHSPFDLSPLKTLVPDDLVAATIFTLSQNQADQVLFHLNFVQTFGTHLPAMNELAYSLVTFEVALAYIRNFKEEEKAQEKGTNEASNASDSEGASTFPWQLPSSDEEVVGKQRSNSFMSFRRRDPRFDKHLEELNRLVDDISFAGTIESKPLIETPLPTASEQSSSPAGDPDDDLGSVSLISLFCYSDPFFLLQCLP